MSKTKIHFDILSLFPESFASATSVSIMKRAIVSGNVELLLHDIRQYAEGLHRPVDDTPYGGGAGMVMKPGPIVEAVKDVEKIGSRSQTIFMSPQGDRFSAGMARELAEYDQLILICGHYEGVDQRARDLVVDREISVGDYVLTGGELPAMIVCDAVSRFVGDVLGNADSHVDESFEMNRLEYPQYTRPAVYRGLSVPDVLMSGHHKKISEWREKRSYLKTKKVRPDIL